MREPALRRMTSIGGQALIEGIMMRGPEKVAAAFLKPDKTIDVVIKDAPLPAKKYKILGLPLIRGVANMINSLSIGMKFLTESATRAEEYEEAPAEPDKLEMWLEKHFSKETIDNILIGVSMVLGILLPIGLYILLPSFLTSFLRPFIKSSLALNLIEGVIKMGIFLLFLKCTSLMKDMQRVYAFHGAEHKSIYCYEKGLPLTVENIHPQMRFHPRCGTSFLFVVLIVGILVYSFISWNSVWMRILIRLICLPILVGVTYEINRVVGRHDNAVTRIIRAPGLLVQRMTVFEPDDDMIRAAIEAVKPVIPDDGSDKW
ncbi:MAG: DUF1385 domain-containing protein [Clostridia bacterium]|nr:DUF1385 domain-containing protein [Clostridia bacterium]